MFVVACYHPIDAWRLNVPGATTINGKAPIVFKEVFGMPGTEMKLPCGRCIGCRLEKSRQWAIRCLHESQLHDYNCFLTLTYNPASEHLIRHIDKKTGEITLSLNKRDYMLFLKNLRQKILRYPDLFLGKSQLRFFQCGEYGDEHIMPDGTVHNPRPHHHMIIFGIDFKDRSYWKQSTGFPLYTSETLKELWPHGYSTIADVTFESAAYVARYITKKINGDMADDHYGGRTPEYITMSRRPGIAREFAEQYLTSIYPKDSILVRPGMIARPPKFYDQIYDIHYPEKFLKIKEKRKRYLENRVEENTEERLLVKEKIQKIKADMLIRPIEKDVYT